MTPLASLVVVSWNGRHHLARLLAALERQTLREYELIVVDNASTDGSAALVGETAPGATVVRSQTNRGFAGGNNLGIERARGRYVALLNNDCLPEPAWLEAAVACAEHAPGRTVATTLLRADAPDTLDSAGIALDRSGTAWDRGGGEPAAACDGLPPLFGPSGGGALYPRELFAAEGGFETSYWMYYEDVELAWRARLAGWGCAQAVDARALHLGSASAGRNSPLKRFLLARNKLWTIARCYPAEGLRRQLVPIVLTDAAALAWYVGLSSPNEVGWRARLAAFRGRLAGLAGLGRHLAARPRIQRAAAEHGAATSAAMVGLEPPWRALRRFAHLPEAGAG